MLSDRPTRTEPPPPPSSELRYGPTVNFAPLTTTPRAGWDVLTWADGYGFGPPLASNYVRAR